MESWSTTERLSYGPAALSQVGDSDQEANASATIVSRSTEMLWELTRESVEIVSEASEGRADNGSWRIALQQELDKWGGDEFEIHLRSTPSFP